MLMRPRDRVSSQTRFFALRSDCAPDYWGSLMSAAGEQFDAETIAALSSQTGAPLSQGTGVMPLEMLHRTVHVGLDARTTATARKEIARRWPALDVEFIGLDSHGEAVFISWVRKLGDEREAPTAIVPNAKPVVRFVARIPI